MRYFERAPLHENFKKTNPHDLVAEDKRRTTLLASRAMADYAEIF